MYARLNAFFFKASLFLTLVLSTAAFASQPFWGTRDLQAKLGKAAPNLNPVVLQLAVNAMQCAIDNGLSPASKLSVIDYSLASTQARLWVFDLQTGRLLFNELVAHGKNSGDNYAKSFSNQLGSLQSSLGLFVTKDTYDGSNGYSLRMEGLDQGFNDKAMERAIVFHGAPYVNPEHIEKFGRIGRSWGCPAVNAGVAKKVIDTIKGEQFLFSYYPDKRWLSSSKLLNCANALASREDNHNQVNQAY